MGGGDGGEGVFSFDAFLFRCGHGCEFGLVGCGEGGVWWRVWCRGEGGGDEGVGGGEGGGGEGAVDVCEDWVSGFFYGGRRGRGGRKYRGGSRVSLLLKALGCCLCDRERSGKHALGVRRECALIRFWYVG